MLQPSTTYSWRCHPAARTTPRQFYVGVLGLAEETKPPVLAARGGCWFERGPVACTSVSTPTSARRARPTRRFVVAGLPAFVVERGARRRWADDVRGLVRCYVDDPFGNRIELIERELSVSRAVRYRGHRRRSHRDEPTSSSRGRARRRPAAAERGRAVGTASAPAASRCGGRWSWCATRA